MHPSEVSLWLCWVIIFCCNFKAVLLLRSVLKGTDQGRGVGERERKRDRHRTLICCFDLAGDCSSPCGADAEAEV